VAVVQAALTEIAFNLLLPECLPLPHGAEPGPCTVCQVPFCSHLSGPPTSHGAVRSMACC
jgi:hypothetical protein